MAVRPWRRRASEAVRAGRAHAGVEATARLREDEALLLVARELQLTRLAAAGSADVTGAPSGESGGASRRTSGLGVTIVADRLRAPDEPAESQERRTVARTWSVRPQASCPVGDDLAARRRDRNPMRRWASRDRDAADVLADEARAVTLASACASVAIVAAGQVIAHGEQGRRRATRRTSARSAIAGHFAPAAAALRRVCVVRPLRRTPRTRRVRSATDAARPSLGRENRRPCTRPGDTQRVGRTSPPGAVRHPGEAGRARRRAPRAAPAAGDPGRVDPLRPYRIPPASVQPASLDLRLGEFAWALRCSFLPTAESKVEDKIADIAFQQIDLRDGATLERDRPYLVPLIEELAPAGGDPRQGEPEELDRPPRRLHPGDHRRQPVVRRDRRTATTASSTSRSCRARSRST